MRDVRFLKEGISCGILRGRVGALFLLTIFATISRHVNASESGRLRSSDQNHRNRDRNNQDGTENLEQNARILNNSRHRVLAETNHKHSNNNDSPAQIIFATAGGGWRAMISTMAINRVMSKIDALETLNGYGSGSGASWATLQLFYSQPFYNKVTQGTDNEFGIFVRDWMNAYNEIWPKSRPRRSDFCGTMNLYGLLGLYFVPYIRSIIQACPDIEIVFEEWSWSNGMAKMIQAVSTIAYDDPSLVTRPLTKSNQVEALKNVNMHIQTSFSPNTANDDGNVHTSFGPSSSGDGESGTRTVYNVPLPLQYFLSSSNEGATSNSFAELYPCNFFDPSTLSAYESDAPLSSDPINPESGSVTLESSDDLLAPTLGETSQRWKEPNFLQVLAASSAFLSFIGRASPSVFNQAFGYYYDRLPFLTSRIFLRFLNNLWDNEQLSSTAVCTSFEIDNHFDCSKGIGRYMDAGYTDGAGLTQTIGIMQQKILQSTTFGCSSSTFSSSSTISSTSQLPKIKVIYVLPSAVGESTIKFAMYWNYGSGAQPGEYVFEPDVQVPIASKQLFAEELTESDIDNVLEDIIDDDVQIKTGIFQGTTITNPIYGLQSGQSVEVFLIVTSYDIPTILISRDVIEDNIEPLVGMARSISSSKVLASRLESFLQDDSGETEDSDNSILF